MPSFLLLVRLALVILLAMTGMGCATLDGTKSSKDASPEWPDPHRFDEEIQKFSEIDMRARYRPGSIVALGSSSIKHWHGTIHEDLAPLPVMARGFGGSNMNDAAFFVDRIAINYAPSGILLYEGDNDIGSGISAERVYGKFQELKAKVRAALPECRFYIIAIKPSPSRWDKWPEMQKANALLKADAEKDGNSTFIDVATPMLGPDGKPRPEIFEEDQLHMNRKGYEIWAATIKPVLEAQTK